MFLDSFRITGSAVAQIFLLGLFGFLLMRRNFLGEACLDSLSRLTINITLPILIFCQLIKDFSFQLYPSWWIFPLLSIAITGLGLLVGAIFVPFIKGQEHKLQFLSLISFQNSGYLPLALIAALLPAAKSGIMFMYLFLFLLGFNLVMFSLGVFMLAYSKARRFELKSLFNPPVLAVIISLILVYFGLNRFLPDFIFKPLKMVGDCTLPLSMLVVGGNLAQIHLQKVDKKAVFYVMLGKLLIMPAIGLLLIMKFHLYSLAGLLILIQLAAPPATTPSVIIRHYKKDDLLISQGIFYGHMLCIITLPLFLSLYFAIGMLK